MDKPFWHSWDGAQMTMGLTYQSTRHTMQSWHEYTMKSYTGIDSLYEELAFMSDHVTGIRLALDHHAEGVKDRSYRTMVGPSYASPDPEIVATRSKARKPSAVGGFRLAAASKEVCDGTDDS